MFTVTAGAGDRLSTKLAGKKADNEQALRFTQCPDGWKLRLDYLKPADLEFKHNGRTVLLLDTKISQAMNDLTLDVMNTDAGPRLKLRRVNSTQD